MVYKLTFDMNPSRVDKSYPCYIFIIDVGRRETLEYLEDKLL